MEETHQLMKVTDNESLKMDSYLKPNIDFLIKRNKHDFDSWLIFCGEPRSGKSTLSLQIGAYIASRFHKQLTMKNICFSSDEFKKRIRKADKYDFIQYDEARRGLNKNRAMSTINQSMVDMASEIGYKNLFISIIAPDFFSLMKDISIDRSVCLIKTNLRHGLERGYFDFYNKKEKEVLYIEKKKYRIADKAFSVVNPSFKGFFDKYFPVDKLEYESKKTAFIKAGKDSEYTYIKERFNNLIWNLHKNFQWSSSDLAMYSGYSQRNIGFILELMSKKALSNPETLIFEPRKVTHSHLKKVDQDA